MDLSELTHTPTPDSRRMPASPDAQALVAQLGSEVAATLSCALERATTLAATGRISRDGLSALHEEIDRARRAGIMGQQVARLADGHLDLAHERLNLTALLRAALCQRRREIEARGLQVRQAFAAAEVMSDATLLFSLIQTALDWSFEHAVSRIDLELDVRGWPARASWVIAFAHQPADEVVTAAAPMDAAEVATLSTMSWRLLQQTAAALGLRLRRCDTPGKSQLTLEFPDTLAPRLEGLASSDETDASTPSHSSQPLAGRHVLVLAARREVRHMVRDALRPLGLMLDFVSSVAEAGQLCSGGLPHAVVYESALAGDRFERLRGELLAAVPVLALVEIAEQGKGFEVLSVGGRQFASVGRDAIIDSLPAALLFELSRNE